MINVEAVNNDFAIVCGYKHELALVSAALEEFIPSVTYYEGTYKSLPTIFVNRDNSLPDDYNSEEALSRMIKNEM